jgi:uncharacterized membrane protein
MADSTNAAGRLAASLTVMALSTAAWGAGVACAQSDTGGAEPGESASTWDGFLGLLGWILLVVVVLELLAWAAFRRSRTSSGEPQPAAADTDEPAPPAPPARPAEPGAEPDARDLTVLTFAHTEGAERAYADARGRAGDAPWLSEVAFVESHRHGRIVVRGTFAGHYLDVDDLADAIGHDTAVGAVAGAVVGLAFGPPGFAAGLVAGGTAGGVRESATHVPEERGPLFDEIRRDVTEGSSGLVALVSPADTHALVEALHARAVRVTYHRLSAAEAAALRAAVAQAPRAATPDI